MVVVACDSFVNLWINVIFCSWLSVCVWWVMLIYMRIAIRIGRIRVTYRLHLLFAGQLL